MLVALSNEVGFEQAPGDGGCGEWGSCVAASHIQMRRTWAKLLSLWCLPNYKD